MSEMRRYGELFDIRGFLRLRAENVGYNVHFPHSILLLLHVVCKVLHGAGFFVLRLDESAIALSITFLFPSLG